MYVYERTCIFVYIQKKLEELVQLKRAEKERQHRLLEFNHSDFDSQGKPLPCFDEDDDYFVATIKDYGPGIEDADMPFIFEKFYRGKNSKGKNGTGLGLYIVKYMIEKMGGKVDLISNDGLCAKLFFKKIVS